LRVNPLLGVFFHWLGRSRAASFYVPYKGIRRWFEGDLLADAAAFFPG
jgi:hypothetical protein